MISAISIENLSKTYPRSWAAAPMQAVNQVNLEVAVGETFGFIGPNGAGKSTTIKILTGALRPTGGSARLFGVDVESPGARVGLGYVPENPSVYDFLTPLEILTMGLRLHNVQVPDERRHCLEWLDRFGLGQVAGKTVRAFSKGMTQRVALAHALAIKPRLLILDEPLSGLDPVGRKDVVEILGEYRSAGGTLFFSSHVLHDVEAIADRFGLIHKGQMLTIRSPQEVVADQADRYMLRYRTKHPVADASSGTAHLHSVEVAAADLADQVARIQAAGGILQDVLPKASLESVFFRTIASTAQATS